MEKPSCDKKEKSVQILKRKNKGAAKKTNANNGSSEKSQKTKCKQKGMGKRQEGVVIRIQGPTGYLWSPEWDRVLFTHADLQTAVDMQMIVPGMAATFIIEKRLVSMDVEWKASDVSLQAEQSGMVVEGYGSMTRVHDSFGFIDSQLFDQPIFAPGFAASNNLPPDRACQIDELEAREVHFMAIPNPKNKFENLFCISVHECSTHCRHPTLPSLHWIQADKPVAIPISDNAVQPAEPEVSVFVPNSMCRADLQSFEVVVCLLHQNNGYFWSPVHGKMIFTKKKGCMAPGQAIEVEKLTLAKSPSSSSVFNTKVKRDTVVVTEYSCLSYRSSLVVEGVGVFRWGRSSGVIFDVKSDDVDQLPVLVPLWALRNGNSLLAGKALSESPAKFEGRYVHYIAVQACNGAAVDKRVCVIALHEEAPMCCSPEQMSNKHWQGDGQHAPDLELPITCHGLDVNEPTQPVQNSEEECFLTYVRTNHGYLHHPHKGRVYFDMSVVVGLTQHAVPGTRCLVTVASLTPSKKCKSVWKALCVTLLPGRCSQIFEGKGTVVKAHRTFGMVHCQQTKQQLFLPGWAGVNCQQSGSKGWQVPDLAQGCIHFLAMSNPKIDHQSEPFIISAHPVQLSCDTPMAQHPLHWANPNSVPVNSPHST